MGGRSGALGVYFDWEQQGANLVTDEIAMAPRREKSAPP